MKTQASMLILMLVAATSFAATPAAPTVSTTDKSGENGFCRNMAAMPALFDAQ